MNLAGWVLLTAWKDAEETDTILFPFKVDANSKRFCVSKNGDGKNYQWNVCPRVFWLASRRQLLSVRAYKLQRENYFMADISGRSTDRLFAGNSKLLSSLSLCGACHRKEKGACFVNYCSLLTWLMALCWALLSEVLYKMDLWHVAYHWLSSSQIPNLQQQPFLCLMILWVRNSGQAQLLSYTLPCGIDWGHTWYLVGWWAGLVWRVGDSFTQKSSTSVGMGRRLSWAGSWLSANAGLTSMGGVRGEREKEGRRGRRGEGSRDQTLMGNLLLEETLHLLFVTTSLSCLIRSSPGPLNYQRLSWWPCVIRNALGLGKSVSSWAKGPHSKAIIYYHWDTDQINLTFLTTPSCCLGHKRGQENQNYWGVKEGKLRNVSFSRLGTDSRHQL